jgi:hypothetical protein
MAMESKLLLDVIGHDCATQETGYCIQPSAITKYPPNQKYYWDWEDVTAKPALEKLGYKVIGWYTDEGDSFGPLSRIVVVEKDGIKSEMWYW